MNELREERERTEAKKSNIVQVEMSTARHIEEQKKLAKQKQGSARDIFKELKEEIEQEKREL